jgi:hypothetical protein
MFCGFTVLIREVIIGVFQTKHYCAVDWLSESIYQSEKITIDSTLYELLLRDAVEFANFYQNQHFLS